jgi:predicted NUDIX family NTP pyrophosphohydrolase
MPETSFGLVLYRRDPDAVRVLLAHPGGPLWQARDAGAWTIPKGAATPGESGEAAALREFEEELGTPVSGALQALGRIRQRSGKWVEAFALEGDFDVATVRSNTFEMAWPPRSGRVQAFPEIDRAAWFTLEEARGKVLEAQFPLLERVEELVR